MDSQPRFLQGMYPFEGLGLDKPFLLDEQLTYRVPPGLRGQFVYFRGGNSSDEMICVVLLRDGEPMRYFPVAARGDTHVALRVVEDLLSDTLLEVHLAAPAATAGHVVVDIGLVEF
ncbi:MAG: molybdopterin oxidoreductase [Actinomycetota bacterium]|nr:molybdopterin oxidoreductase [Actinomycetota bacterium]